MSSQATLLKRLFKPRNKSPKPFKFKKIVTPIFLLFRNQTKVHFVSKQNGLETGIYSADCTKKLEKQQ